MGLPDALGRPPVRPLAGPDRGALDRSIPPALEIDTFEGQAWLGIVPFRMEDVAPRVLPAPPGPGAFPELNVRTYVTPRRPGRGLVPEPGRGEPARGRGARAAFHLPYYRARMSADSDAGWVDYRSERADPARPGGASSTDATGRRGPVAPGAAPDRCEAFLTDRLRALRRGSSTAGSRGRRSGTHHGRSSRPRPRSGSMPWRSLMG